PRPPARTRLCKAWSCRRGQIDTSARHSAAPKFRNVAYGLLGFLCGSCSDDRGRVPFMNFTKQHVLLSLGSVGVGALAVGMVLASGLGLAPLAQAAKEPAAPVAAAGLPVASALPDFATLAERVTPSVVSVYTE